jgi:NAD dependent epimerase/dehydratase family enzyme
VDLPCPPWSVPDIRSPRWRAATPKIYRDAGDRWIAEDAPVDDYPIAAGNHAAEASARRFEAISGESVVLRFGLFYGVGAAHSEQFLALARRHVGFVAGRGDTYMSSIHLVDAAAAVVEALGCQAGTYNIVDDEPARNAQMPRRSPPPC